MLFLTFLSLISTTTALLPLSDLLDDDVHRRLVPREAQNDTCSVDCDVVLSVTSRCVTNSSDARCGCTEYINNSTQCLDCLTRTNTNVSVAGLPIVANGLSLSIAFCKCLPVSECDQLASASHDCRNTTCLCPNVNKYGPGCAPCLKSNGGNATTIDTLLKACQSGFPTPKSGALSVSTALPAIYISLAAVFIYSITSFIIF